MNLIIKKLIIFSKRLKTAKEVKFFEGFNIITGKNKSGKSCIAKSIMYTLGCDVVFEQEWEDFENTYLLFFDLNNNSFALCRKNLNGKQLAKGANYFILTDLSKNKKYIFNSVGEFATHLNTLFDFNIKLQNRFKNNELTNLYPNHIFLLNYVDQDTSWSSLLTDTYDKLGFLVDYKNAITEYLLGYRDNIYYAKLYEKNILENELKELRIQIEKLRDLANKESLQVSAVENIDVAQFEKEYNLLVERYESILKSENEYKINISKLYADISFYANQIETTENAIGHLKKNREIHKCPMCDSTIEQNITDLYSVEDSIWDLSNQISQNRIKIEDLQQKLNVMRLQLSKIKLDAQQIEFKLKDKEYKIEFVRKLADLGIEKVINEINGEILDIENKLNSYTERYKQILDQLSKIEKNPDVIKSFYKGLEIIFNKLNIQLKFKSDYRRDFFSFRTNYSGTDKNKTFIGFYATVNMLMQKRGIIFPFIIDTPFKDDFDDDNMRKVFALISSMFSDPKQQCILFTSQNKSSNAILNELTNANITKISGERNLLDGDWQVLMSTYKEYIGIE